MIGPFEQSQTQLKLTYTCFPTCLYRRQQERSIDIVELLSIVVIQCKERLYTEALEESRLRWTRLTR